MAGTSENHLVNHLLKQSQLQQVSQSMSSHILNMSKTGHSTHTLGKQVQCSASLTVQVISS